MLDLTTDPPTLLRPGLVTLAMIEAVIGQIARSAAENTGSPARSPGLSEKHYAPRTPLEIVHDSGEKRVRYHLTAGRRVGWLTLGPANRNAPEGVRILEMPAEPAAFAARLYDALHALDEAGLDVLVAQQPPADEAWTAVHDRLSRAGRIPE